MSAPLIKHAIAFLNPNLWLVRKIETFDKDNLSIDILHYVVAMHSITILIKVVRALSALVTLQGQYGLPYFLWFQTLGVVDGRR